MKVGRHQISNRPKRCERHRRCQEKARQRKLYWEQEYRRLDKSWSWEGAYRLLWFALFAGLVLTFVILWRPK